MSNRKSIIFYAGFFGSFQITSIILKLCGAITWNWWQVMLPTFIGIVFPFAFIVVMFTVTLMWSMFKKW